jgi:hypothetical protein
MGHFLEVSSYRYMRTPGISDLKEKELTGQWTWTFSGNGFTETVVYNLGATNGSSLVPEPTTIAMWSLLGLCGVGYGLRRKNKKTS